MYGTTVYNVRTEFQRSNSSIRKVIFRFLGLFLLLFLVRQFMDIPLNLLNQASSSFLNFGSGTGGVTVSLTSAIQHNQLVQSVVVFFTGIAAVCTKFYDEIKALIIK